MTLKYFNHNPLEEKIHLVQLHGQLLVTREKELFIVALYHMGEFFAEVWHSRVTFKVALAFGFNEGAFLEPYLERIGLSELKE
ncbi:hypothetical protein [Pontibacter pamirensis]|uniref:hypothetical protein n=1 Tax=Pontibacter pamirensis TaxID=2562824 RepID=UPI00138A606A|nr:hypothetical protein [Pontibacter pamirensis]